MVRLEVSETFSVYCGLFVFQFQNGTIRRGEVIHAFDFGTGFQFQNGTIRRFRLRLIYFSLSLISIPKWYD